MKMKIREAMTEMDTQQITRFEVIDEQGRQYVKWNCKVEIDIQDNGRTMKCFITKPSREKTPIQMAKEEVRRTMKIPEDVLEK